MNVGSRKGDERRNIDGLKPVESVAEAAALLHDLELPDRLAALHAVCADAERRPSEPLSVAEAEAAG
eukprot:COSAG03_NODE_5856_length_1161_cov_1.158192_1_plen_67_part_00